MLTNLSQIKGGQALRSDVDALQLWKSALTAAGINTSTSDGNEGVLTIQDAIDKIVSTADINNSESPVNLATLKAAIDTINNKEIKDVVKTDLAATYANEAYTVDVSGVDANLKTAANNALPVYLADGRVVYADANGSSQLTINLTTGAFSGTPYLLEDKVANRGNNETEAGVDVYYEIGNNFNFKVFAEGTWTFGTLPANALLDNQEMKSLAYDQAINSIVKKIATDEDVVAAISELVGQTAVATQITTITDTLYRYASIVGTDAVAESTPGAGDGVDAEAITSTTPVYSKNKVDQLLANANSDNTTELNKKYEFANITTASAVTAVAATANNFGQAGYVAPLAGVTAEGAATKSTVMYSGALVDAKIDQAVKDALDTASAGVLALDTKTYDFANIVGRAAAAAVGTSGDVGYVAAADAETVTESTQVYSKAAVDYIKSIVDSNLAIAVNNALTDARNNADRIDDILDVYKPVVETVTVDSANAVTTFNLTSTPTDTLVKMYINGVVYFENDEFTVDRQNNTVTWSFAASDQPGHIEGVDGFTITNAVTNKVRFEYFTGTVAARTVTTA